MSMLPAGGRFPNRSLWAGLLLCGALQLGLGGCQTSPPAPGPAARASPAPAELPVTGAQEYKVVPEESLLQILVYRGGPMARLGHNHVIASHRVEGAVQVADELTATQFEIHVPVNELTVDEPAMCESAGADFPPGVPQSARDGTRKNLLSEALLDGANYPAIRLRATDVVAAGDAFDVGVEITLKDQVRNVRVPVRLERREGAAGIGSRNLINQ